ncbi:Uncharacterised protein [Cedecea neteri]|uniref:Uncharacterized protein n=1 Tax=Cedecea neteri TaxID=158822 RepID=A0A2X3J849_9ENTR|nr:Uncharacterised protein [Cedecea neteri]
MALMKQFGACTNERLAVRKEDVISLIQSINLCNCLILSKRYSLYHLSKLRMIHDSR